MFQLNAVYGAFCDAWAADSDSRLVFLSAWGRDASIQELLGRLTLPGSEQGIQSLYLADGSRTTLVEVPDPNQLSKQLRRVKTPLFGELVHLLVYQQVVAQADRANGRAFLVGRAAAPDEAGIDDVRVWSCLRDLCHLPLLDQWQEVVLRTARQAGWVQELRSYGINAVAISLDRSATEEEISRLVRVGMLSSPLTVDRPLSQGLQGPDAANEANTSEEDDLFGPVIHSYSRAQALEDGYLVDVSETAAEAGLRYPTGLTRAVWDDCVEWDKQDGERRGPKRDQYVHQDESGRLWDVIWMAAMAIRSNRSDPDSTRLPYWFYRIPRQGSGLRAKKVCLHIHIGPGDQGESVLTIMLPNED